MAFLEGNVDQLQGQNCSLINFVNVTLELLKDSVAVV